MARGNVDAAGVDFFQVEARRADAVGDIGAILAHMIPLAKAALALARGDVETAIFGRLGPQRHDQPGLPPGFNAR